MSITISTVSNIINNNENLSINDALNLGIISLFAQRDEALEITENVIKLYLKANITNENLLFTLYCVLFAMIDAYSLYEQDYQRLLNIINEKANDELQTNFDLYQDAIDEINFYKEILQENNKRLDTLQSVNQGLESKNQDLESEIQELKKQIDKLKKKS